VPRPPACAHLGSHPSRAHAGVECLCHGMPPMLLAVAGRCPGCDTPVRSVGAVKCDALSAALLRPVSRRSHCVSGRREAAPEAWPRGTARLMTHMVRCPTRASHRAARVVHEHPDPIRRVGRGHRLRRFARERGAYRRGERVRRGRAEPGCGWTAGGAGRPRRNAVRPLRRGDGYADSSAPAARSPSAASTSLKHIAKSEPSRGVSAAARNAPAASARR
jgi:hypothetical protein